MTLIRKQQKEKREKTNDDMTMQFFLLFTHWYSIFSLSSFAIGMSNYFRFS